MIVWNHEIQGFYWAAPRFFLLLLLIPVWIWTYRTMQAKRWREAIRFSYAALAEYLRQPVSPWKRLLVPISNLIIAVLLIMALARPVMMVRVPSNAVEMMLVLDISLSMKAEDIKPSRIEAAKAAARQFILSLPDDTNIGLEFFAGSSSVVSPPIEDHDKIIAYLESLKKEDLQLRTEIGTAIQSALQALQTPLPARPAVGGANIPGPETSNKNQVSPEKVIVLLSDGDSREGYPWPQAAANAKQRNVSIFTVGIGSEAGSTIDYQGQVLPVMFNEDTLRNIAEIARGQYFRVFKEKDFKIIYDKVRERTIHFKRQPVEISFLFAGVALLVLCICQILDLFWIRRFPPI